MSQDLGIVWSILPIFAFVVSDNGRVRKPRAHLGGKRLTLGLLVHQGSVVEFGHGRNQGICHRLAAARLTTVSHSVSAMDFSWLHAGDDAQALLLPLGWPGCARGAWPARQSSRDHEGANPRERHLPTGNAQASYHGMGYKELLLRCCADQALSEVQLYGENTRHRPRPDSQRPSGHLP